MPRAARQGEAAGCKAPVRRLAWLAGMVVASRAGDAPSTKVSLVSPELSPQEFKLAVQETARELATSGSVFITPPSYEVEGRRLRYHVGGVDCQALGLNDEFSLAVCVQLQAQILEQLFESRAPGQGFWREPVGSLFAVVDEVSSGRTDSGFEPKALAARREKALAQLESEIRKVAAAGGLTAEKLVFEPGRNKALGFPIEITTDPPGGTVRIVSYLAYKRAHYYGKQDKLPWITLSATETLMGRYHYLATWTDDKMAEGNFEVDRPKAFTFRPD